MLALVLTLLLILAGSAMCSATEVALLSISPLRLRQLASHNNRQAIAVLAIRDQISRPIAGIVILNNLFNIVGSVVVGNQAAALFSSVGLGIFSAVLTLLIIVFGEITPKTLGERFADPVALWMAAPVRLLTWALLPLIILVERLTFAWTRREPRLTTNEAEIQLLTQIGHQEGVIEANELHMIQRVFQLNDLRAMDVMTPRVAMTYVEGSLPLRDCQDAILQSQHSRIVIIDGDIDRVLGIGLKSDLLTGLIHQRGDMPVRQFSRAVQFVPDVTRLDTLLKRFQSSHDHLVIVVDEYGGVAGVVTLEDVVEVLTGEIVDETDRATDLQAMARQRLQRLLASNYQGSSGSPEKRP